jgi:hypothetical protein
VGTRLRADLAVGAREFTLDAVIVRVADDREFTSIGLTFTGSNQEAGADLEAVLGYQGIPTA